MEKDQRVYKKICNGRYAVVDILGKGAMGCVYLAHDGESGKKIALKMLPREVSDVVYEMEELKKNYDKVESLHHPHIAAVKHLVKVPEDRRIRPDDGICPRNNGRADGRTRPPTSTPWAF